MSTLLLRRPGAWRRLGLDPDTRRVIVELSRGLVAFAVPAPAAAVVHEFDDSAVGWSREGAVRLARMLPPSYHELAASIIEFHEIAPS
jgi:hypothetical protein